MLRVMTGSWCQGLVVLSENITLRMDFCFCRALATELCALLAIRGLSAKRKDAATKTYEGQLGTGVGWGGQEIT